MIGETEWESSEVGETLKWAERSSVDVCCDGVGEADEYDDSTVSDESGRDANEGDGEGDDRSSLE